MPATDKKILDKLDLRSVIDRSAVVHYLASAARPYALTYVGQSAEARTGYPSERFTADADFWLECIHPDDRDRALLARDLVSEGKAQPLEYRFRHATGDWRWIHDEATLVRDAQGQPFVLSGVWLDITEHKLAEVLLEKQKAFAESLIANAPTIVLILDERGRVLKVNPYFEKKTGHRAVEAIGKDWFATFLPPDDRPRLRELFKGVLERGMISGYVNSIVAKDGKVLEIEWFGQVLTDASGKFSGLLCIGHDVTERLGYERALEASKRAAARANSAKSRFLVTASHDLRQPLQTLLLLNSALRKTAHDARQEEMLAMQSQALKGMSSLLNALLDIGRLESGVVQPRLEDVSMGEVFARVQAELALQAREKGLKLCADAEAVSVHTDAELFTQLIRNVVANAIRYTQAGQISLSCQCDTKSVRVWVADTGIGIPTDQREAIFDEFYQIDRGGSRGGLGLGLSIVKRIAELLDIDIEVDSKLGEGSRFCFTVARGAAALPAQSPRGPDMNAIGGTVLLVDDDPAVLAASRLFLEMEGYTVVAAASPAEVYEAIATESRPIDLIITDYHLQQTESGLDIVSTVRQRLGRDVPAIIVTGDTSPVIGVNRLEGLELMSKPIDTSALLSVTQRLLTSRTL
jgi:PAS domain S-box-containing protein